MLDEPLYNALRTEQQLGYSVSLSPTNTAGRLGFLVAVTSDHAPSHVEAAIERFLADAVHTLQKLSAAQFEKHVSSLAVLRLEPFKNVSELAEEHWGSAWRCTYDFHDRYHVRIMSAFSSPVTHLNKFGCGQLSILSASVFDVYMDRARIRPHVERSEFAVQCLRFDQLSCEVQVVHELRQLTKEDLLQFYSTHVPAGSKQRRRLTVHVCSQQPQNEHARCGLGGNAKGELNGKPKHHHHSHLHVVQERQVEVVDIEKIKAGLPMEKCSSGKPPGV